MKREIKFRAWCYEKMIYEKDISHLSLEDTPVYKLAKFWCNIPPDSKTMQFTGLHDKNGKEIYEGDVVECYDHPTGVESGTFEIYFEHGHYKCRGSIIPLHDFGTVWTEVIGNIYEHPNLIP